MSFIVKDRVDWVFLAEYTVYCKTIVNISVKAVAKSKAFSYWIE